MGRSFVAAVAICASALVLPACDSSSQGGDSVDVVEVQHTLESDAASGQTGALGVDSEPENKPVVHWAKPGLAPLFIDDGTDEGRGIGDQMFVQVKDLMPQFYHVNLNLNYPRLLEELRKGSDVCAILHYNQERAKFMTYSKPVIVTPSYQLYVSSKGLEKFKQQTGWTGEPASFDELLLKSRGLKMAITPGQSYGAERDEILARHIDNVELIRSFADQEALVKMLAANRMDMVLGFPWVINYRLEQLDVRSDLVKVPLNDVSSYESAYIACADTALGRRVVSAVNAISPPIHDRSKSFLTRWLTAKESQEYYRVYQDYFNEGKALP
ncbi:MAG: hypothetical protein ACRBBW_16435 [Cellvibrionaceae bacterium]